MQTSTDIEAYYNGIKHPYTQHLIIFIILKVSVGSNNNKSVDLSLKNDFVSISSAGRIFHVGPNLRGRYLGNII